MIPLRRLVPLVLACAFIVGCGTDRIDPVMPDEGTAGPKDHGISWLYDGSTIPEIHIGVSLKEWNSLLQAYDRDPATKLHIHCDVSVVKFRDTATVTDASLRLRGNTSRRRPEGGGGSLHSSKGTDWHHCHYEINFHKWHKDADHKVHGAEKVILKWYKDDPSYVRENFCYDLFRRAGVWTAANAAYARLFIKVEGDAKETCLGVYDMVEPVAADFLKVRKAEGQFGNADGFLWRCRSGARLGASAASIGPDLDDGKEYVYELKTRTGEFEIAKAQLQDFLSNSNNLGNQSFKAWLSSHCDVPLLLRTYAVNVAVGMWDDYWNNCNNYYIYFNSTDTKDYGFFFIPYDYDNTLGTTLDCGVQTDAASQDPFNWGDSRRNPLIWKILQDVEWRAFYADCLLDLVSEGGLMSPEAAGDRIRSWQNKIRYFVPNDTHEDEKIEDLPAPWSNHREYRLLEEGPHNYFTAKRNSILKYCK